MRCEVRPKKKIIKEHRPIVPVQGLIGTERLIVVVLVVVVVVVVVAGE